MILPAMTHRLCALAPAVVARNGLLKIREALWLLALLAAAGCSDNTVSGTVVPGSGGASNDADGGSLDSNPFGGSDGLQLKLDLPPVDAGPVQGEFGWPCDKSAECNSGLCVDSPKGKVCSKYCTDDCPKGFACVEQVLPGTTDKAFICASRDKYICDPCEQSVTCNEPGQSGNLCLKNAKFGSFCGVKCNPKVPDCPNGYACDAATDPETGLSSYQCQPEKGGECTCSANAISLGLKTPCVNHNANGDCMGFRQCTDSGLSGCTALVPKAEECNGIDDDCNGKTDDFQAGAKCDLVNEFGTCKGQVKECVDGKPVCDGKPAKPEACNGIDDNCDGKTDEALCEDGDPCTNDTCNTDGSCKHIQLGGMACDDGSICTQTDKCVAGKCLGGKEMNCDDKDPCTTDSCNPIDGCQHKEASDSVCPDDGEACTQDLCKDGKCTHPQASDGTKCAEDGKPCTADICTNGKCVHPQQDGIECTDDGKPCTNDVCTNGNCTHTANTGKLCEDGNSCTDKDSCMNGVCKSGKLNLCDDGNPCTKDTCLNNAGCVHDPNGGNGLPCKAPSGDCPLGVCSGGACFSSPNQPCTYKYDGGICNNDLDIPGTCSASGKCAANKNAVPGKVSCTVPCKSVCIACSVMGLPIQLCLDGVFGF